MEYTDVGCVFSSYIVAVVVVCFNCWHLLQFGYLLIFCSYC